jgi:hypothetical protein
MGNGGEYLIWIEKRKRRREREDNSGVAV